VQEGARSTRHGNALLGPPELSENMHNHGELPSNSLHVSLCRHPLHVCGTAGPRYQTDLLLASAQCCPQPMPPQSAEPPGFTERWPGNLRRGPHVGLLNDRRTLSQVVTLMLSMPPTSAEPARARLKRLDKPLWPDPACEEIESERFSCEMGQLASLDMARSSTWRLVWQVNIRRLMLAWRT
jgi:hypothetical protein